MTLEEYRKLYNNAPYDIMDFALGALNLNIELSDIAQNYINAREQLETELNNLNINIG